MKNLMKIAVLALLLLAGESAIGQVRWGVGLYFGTPPPPPPPRQEVIVVRPYPEAVWVPGYWNYQHPHYVWVPGRWDRPPMGRGAWVAPHWKHHPQKGYYCAPGHWGRRR